MDVRLVRAFIASPGGLDTEREAARAAADEVNISVARALGYRLELLGWEETISGAGRAQAQINAEMNTCDLFIGCMWLRWGSRPSIDGPYSSGFEEEFELSTIRRTRTGSPEMSMFFKNVSPHQQSDAGPELQKVLSFRQKLIDEKQFLFKNFDSTEEFAQLVRGFLTPHIISRYHQDNKSQEDDSQKNRAEISTAPDDDTTSKKETEAARQFVKNAVSLESADLDFSPADVARLRLTFIALGKSENDEENVGVHDTNLIFRKGAALPLSYNELRTLVASGLSALNDINVPVWGWIEDFQTQRPGLFPAFSIIGSESRKIGCINAMRLMKHRMSNDDSKLGHREIISRWFSSESTTGVRLAALQYVRSLGIKSDLDLVEVEASRNASETSLAAAETAICIMAKYDGKEAASRLIDLNSDKIDDGIFDLVSDRLEEITTDRLTLALDHRFARVRAKAIELLSARNELTVDIIDRAAIDPSPIVRLAAAYAYDSSAGERTIEDAGRFLVQHSASALRHGLLFGKTNADPELDENFIIYRNTRLSKMQDSELRLLLSGTPGYRTAAYFELASRGRSPFTNDLRRDLKDGFQKYVASNWPNGVPSSETALSGLFSDRATPDQTKCKTLTAHGLELIASFQNKSDLSLTRNIIDSGIATPGQDVVKFLRRFGSFEDIARISRMSPFHWVSSTQRLDLAPFESAANAIISLADDRISEALSSDIQDSMKIKIIQVISRSKFKSMPPEEIMNFLFSEISGLRNSVALRIANSMSKMSGKSFLEKYIKDERGRYYSVIHWLDMASNLDKNAAQNVSNQSIINLHLSFK